MTRKILGDVERHGSADASGVLPAAPPTLDKHLLDYARVLVKRRWTALTALASVLVLAGVHAYTASPIYEASAQVLIEHEQPEFSLRDGAAQDRETTDFYQTQYTILQSRSVARRAIETIGGWGNPELSGPGPRDLRPTGVFEGVGRWASATMTGLRGKAASPPAAASKKTPAADVATPGPGIENATQAVIIDTFLDRVVVAPVPNSRLVDVKFRASTPRFAADAANAIARAYIDQNLEVRMAASKETTEWLSEQLADQRRRIEQSELALQHYRETNNAVSLADSQNIVVQKLSDLNEMVTRAKADRISRESLYNQALGLQKSGDALQTMPAVLSNAYVQQLKADLSRLRTQERDMAQRFGDRYPDMIALRATIQETEKKLAGEIANQVEAIRNEYQAAQALEASLTHALDSQKREAETLNRKGIDYGMLEREVRTNRQIFDSLLQRTRERTITGELKSSAVRIIDAAPIPRAPIWPNRRLIMAYAMFFGILFAIGVALFFEYLNDRIKTPDEVKRYLGLPLLGLIPMAAQRRRAGKTPLLADAVSPLFAEACRALRTTVIFSAEGQARCLVVTSTGPGEGKTAVASNLALGLAMTGQRTLLLDVDMRRPQVHNVFAFSQEPGFSDLLNGDVGSREAMRETSVSALWVMPSGRASAHPTELLSSPRFVRLLDTLKGSFEWIIIDSPPVGAVTDACIVANRASAVVFVVGAELTRRSAAAHAVEQLDAAGATFMGCVLNGVRLQRDSFYYSPYYQANYEQYQTRKAV